MADIKMILSNEEEVIEIKELTDFIKTLDDNTKLKFKGFLEGLVFMKTYYEDGSFKSPV